MTTKQNIQVSWWQVVIAILSFGAFLALSAAANSYKLGESLALKADRTIVIETRERLATLEEVARNNDRQFGEMLDRLARIEEKMDRHYEGSSQE